MKKSTRFLSLLLSIIMILSILPVSSLAASGVETIPGESVYTKADSSLYSDTDGIFCDIYGSFASELASLAEYIKKVVKPVDIRLETSSGVKTGTVWNFTLSATISSTDEDNLTTGLSVTLTNLIVGIDDEDKESGNAK